MTVYDRIKHLRPCADAKKWCESFTDQALAWQECPRADWMLWLLGKTVDGKPWSEERKPLLACCLEVAMTVEHLWPERCRDTIGAAVATLRRWTESTASKDEAIEAREKIAAAAYAAAYAAGAAYAAYAAADAAGDGADAAANAAAYAAGAADAAAYAAGAAGDRKRHHKTCADIVRRHYPEPPVP